MHFILSWLQGVAPFWGTDWVQCHSRQGLLLSHRKNVLVLDYTNFFICFYNKEKRLLEILDREFSDQKRPRCISSSFPSIAECGNVFHVCLSLRSSFRQKESSQSPSQLENQVHLPY